MHVQMQADSNTQATPLFRYGPFINYWLRFSTWGERQFLKVFPNHTMLTTPPKFGISRGPILISQLVVGLQLLTIIVAPNFSPSWSDPNFNCLPLRWTTQLSAYTAQSQLTTESFSKSSNSQDHCFLAWRHSHSSLFPIWGLSWQLWLPYSLHASVNCTQYYAPELKVNQSLSSFQ